MSFKSIFSHQNTIAILILLAIIIVNSYSLNSTDHELNLTNTTQATLKYSAKDQPVNENGGGGSGMGIYIGGGVGGGVGLIILFIIICCCCC